MYMYAHTTRQAQGTPMAPPRQPALELSGGWECAIVGVPWRGSVSACLAWGDLFVKHMFEQVLKRLSLLRHHGTPMMAHLQLPEACEQTGRASAAAEVCIHGCI